MGKQIWWTPQEKQFLRKNAQTLTATQISTAIGRTVRSVRAQAIHLRIPLLKIGDKNPSRKYSVEDINLAQQLHAAGMKPRHIAEKLEIPTITLRNYLY